MKLAVAIILAGTALAQEPEILERLRQTAIPAEQKDRVRAALEAKDYKTAESILVGIINSDAKTADVLTLTARVFFLDKDLMNTAIAMKKADKIRPLMAADRFTLAMAYIGMKKGAWARPELERLLTIDKKNWLYTYWLGRLEYDDGKYDRAITRLRSVTVENPTYMRAWDNLGLALEGSGDLEGALASYRQAVKLNREQTLHAAWPHLNLGSLLSKMGQLKEAEEQLREAVGNDERLAEARHQLGVLLHKGGRDDEAIVELKRATELNPQLAGPVYVLGQIYRARGNTKAADEAFARFKALVH
jgi:tetratricopeptide (TPR) repeat protein